MISKGTFFWGIAVNFFPWVKGEPKNFSAWDRRLKSSEVGLQYDILKKWQEFILSFNPVIF